MNDDEPPDGCWAGAILALLIFPFFFYGLKELLR